MNIYSKLSEDTQLHDTVKCNYFGENKNIQPAIFVLANFYHFFPWAWPGSDLPLARGQAGPVRPVSEQ